MSPAGRHELHATGNLRVPPEPTHSNDCNSSATIRGSVGGWGSSAAVLLPRKPCGQARSDVTYRCGSPSRRPPPAVGRAVEVGLTEGCDVRRREARPKLGYPSSTLTSRQSTVRSRVQICCFATHLSRWVYPGDERIAPVSVKRHRQRPRLRGHSARDRGEEAPVDTWGPMRPPSPRSRGDT